VKVSAVFTLTTGRTLTVPIGQELALVSLGKIGGGDRVVLGDLTVMDVACGVFFGDEDDAHADPPDGDWSGKVTIRGKDGTRRRLPYRTPVWRVRPKEGAPGH
jgi:hypothetical protein